MEGEEFKVSDVIGTTSIITEDMSFFMAGEKHTQKSDNYDNCISFFKVIELVIAESKEEIIDIFLESSVLKEFNLNYHIEFFYTIPKTTIEYLKKYRLEKPHELLDKIIRISEKKGKISEDLINDYLEITDLRELEKEKDTWEVTFSSFWRNSAEASESFGNSIMCILNYIFLVGWLKEQIIEKAAKFTFAEIRKMSQSDSNLLDNVRVHMIDYRNEIKKYIPAEIIRDSHTEEGLRFLIDLLIESPEIMGYNKWRNLMDDDFMRRFDALYFTAAKLLSKEKSDEEKLPYYVMDYLELMIFFYYTDKSSRKTPDDEIAVPKYVFGLYGDAHRIFKTFFLRKFYEDTGKKFTINIFNNQENIFSNFRLDDFPAKSIKQICESGSAKKLDFESFESQKNIFNIELLKNQQFFRDLPWRGGRMVAKKHPVEVELIKKEIHMPVEYIKIINEIVYENYQKPLLANVPILGDLFYSKPVFAAPHRELVFAGAVNDLFIRLFLALAVLIVIMFFIYIFARKKEPFRKVI